MRSTAGRRTYRSREGLWTGVSVSPCCPHRQVRFLLPFFISLCWGCKSPCMQRTVKGCTSSEPGKGQHSACRLPCCPLSPQHTVFPLALAPEGRGPQYCTHPRPSALLRSLVIAHHRVLLHSRSSLPLSTTVPEDNWDLC